MTNKITHAPQEVVEELGIDTLVYPSHLLTDIYKMARFENVKRWLGEGDVTDKQLAIVNHVFGKEKLQPEREPRWYVTKKSPWSRNITFVYMLRTGVLSEFAMTERGMSGLNIGYENGISERLANSILAETGGEKVEIK